MKLCKIRREALYGQEGEERQLRFVVQKGIGEMVEFEEGVFATKIEESVAREIIENIKIFY